MDEFINVVCDICKKRPYVTTIEINRKWYGVCKVCKKEQEKKKETKHAKIYM